MMALMMSSVACTHQRMVNSAILTRSGRRKCTAIARLDGSEPGKVMKRQLASQKCRAFITSDPAMYSLAEGLEAPVQLSYLTFLLVILSGAAFVVVRQVLVRREMDERAKELGELIRQGNAVSQDFYELGVVLARKRLYTQALKNYTKSVKLWDGEEVELAQVHNAMGFCYLNMDRNEDALKEFTTATKLQPGYVIAWNNLADVLEKMGRWKDALTAYESAYELQPENDIAKAAVDRLRTKTRRVTTLKM